MTVAHIGKASADRHMQVSAELREWADRVQRGEVESVGLVVIRAPERLAHVSHQAVLDDADRVMLLGALRVLEEDIARHVYDDMREGSAHDVPEGDGA